MKLRPQDQFQLMYFHKIFYKETKENHWNLTLDIKNTYLFKEFHKKISK